MLKIRASNSVADFIALKFKKEVGLFINLLLGIIKSSLIVLAVKKTNLKKIFFEHLIVNQLIVKFAAAVVGTISLLKNVESLCYCNPIFSFRNNIFKKSVHIPRVSE